MGGGVTQPFIVPYMYNPSTENYETETTFGEVRQAFEAGRIVLFCKGISDEDSVNVSWIMGTTLHYEETENSCFGGVGDWSCAIDYQNPPQTLADLDECTLYMN